MEETIQEHYYTSLFIYLERGIRPLKQELIDYEQAEEYETCAGIKKALDKINELRKDHTIKETDLIIQKLIGYED